MKAYNVMTRKELMAQKAELDRQFVEAKGKGLQLDMSRGKPEPAQLDMGMGLLDVLNSESDMKSMEGMDTRNYDGWHHGGEASDGGCDGSFGGQCDCLWQFQPFYYV